MRYLVVDIGNTRAKLTIFDDLTQLVNIETAEHSNMAQAAIDMCQKYQTTCGLFSSVANATVTTNFIQAIEHASLKLHQLTTSLKMPFNIGQNLPPTLGGDRLAAVVGAVAEFAGKEILIVDAGTAITYEYISDRNEYLGGNISPGVTMRFRALSTFTGLLPMSDYSHFTTQIGSNTLNAIAAGVMRGVNYEVEGVITDFLKENDDKKVVILTGGDSEHLVLKVKSCIFARPNLVIDGIANICMANFGI